MLPRYSHSTVTALVAGTYFQSIVNSRLANLGLDTHIGGETYIASGLAEPANLQFSNGRFLQCFSCRSIKTDIGVFNLNSALFF